MLVFDRWFDSDLKVVQSEISVDGSIGKSLVAAIAKVSIQESEAREVDKRRQLLLTKIADLKKKVSWMSRLEGANKEIKELNNMHEFLLLRTRFESIDADKVITGS